MGVLVFLGRGLRISVRATRKFTRKPLLRFCQDILQYIKLYSDALKYDLDRAINTFLYMLLLLVSYYLVGRKTGFFIFF